MAKMAQISARLKCALILELTMALSAQLKVLYFFVADSGVGSHTFSLSFRAP
jgi:hypothetical protein